MFYLHFADRDDAVASAVIGMIRDAVFSAGADPFLRVHQLVDVCKRYEPLTRNLRPSAASERLADFFYYLLLEACRPIAQAEYECGSSSLGAPLKKVRSGHARHSWQVACGK
ncbi:hypothetical protein BKG85_08825 [Mycobacteroides chelonae]|nr:hypothetical protein BKG85_08825 [Mycobacteroides chelonae]